MSSNGSSNKWKISTPNNEFRPLPTYLTKGSIGMYNLGSRWTFLKDLSSLSATFLRRRVIGALRASADSAVQQAVESVTQTAVYSYPTVNDLSDFLVRLVGSGDDNTVLPQTRVEEMIEKYSAGLQKRTPSTAPTPVRAGGAVILLTGSTGNLGAEILAGLLRVHSVERVYALNRPSGAQSMSARHEARFKDKGLDSSLLLSEKLVLVEGDAARPRLGLSDHLYDEVRSLTCLRSYKSSHPCSAAVEICDCRHTQCLEARLQSIPAVIRTQHSRQS